MLEDNNENNLYSMKCVVCGTPLIKGKLLKGHKSVNISHVVGYTNPDNLSYEGLKCPRGHEYILLDISGTIKYEDIKIYGEILKLLNKDIYNLNLKEIILNPNTKTYAVTYGFGTKARDMLRAYWKKIALKPSPSKKVLDNVTIYICSKVKARDLKDKNIVFALVSNRIDLITFQYNIIWYDI